MSKSQNQRILSHLKRGRSITALSALHKFGCLRLAARIKDLRDAGHNIDTTMIGDGKKYALYSMRVR